MVQKKLPPLKVRSRRASVRRPKKSKVRLPPVEGSQTQQKAVTPRTSHLLTEIPPECEIMKRYRQLAQERCDEILKDLQIKIFARSAKREKEPTLMTTVGKLEGGFPVNHFLGPPPDVIWLRVVRYVVLMLSAYGAMIKPFKRTEKVSEKSIKSEFGAKIGKGRIFHFEASQYARGIKETVPENCIQVMNKVAQARSQNDIMLVYSVMMDLPIFGLKYTPEMCWKMAKYIRYTKCEKKKILTKHSRRPILVYFLYSGQVNVVYSNENEATAKAKTIALKPGACLGYSKKTRFSVCATDCEFLTIDREIFESEGFVEAAKREQEDKFNFFRDWMPISDWSDSACYDLAKSSYIDNYPGDRLILYNRRENFSDLVYFVVRGSVDVIKVTSFDRCRERPLKMSESCAMRMKAAIESKFKVSGSVGANLMRSSIECERENISVSTKERAESELIDAVTLANPSEYDGRPLYIKIRSLEEGDCYGLGKLGVADLSEESGRFCLVSRNSTIIRTPCKDLRELISILGVDKTALKMNHFIYESDEHICRKVREWIRARKFFRKEVENFNPK